MQVPAEWRSEHLWFKAKGCHGGFSLLHFVACTPWIFKNTAYSLRHKLICRVQWGSAGWIGNHSQLTKPSTLAFKTSGLTEWPTDPNTQPPLPTRTHKKTSNKVYFKIYHFFSTRSITKEFPGTVHWQIRYQNGHRLFWCLCPESMKTYSKTGDFGCFPCHLWKRLLPCSFIHPPRACEKIVQTKTE